MPKMRQNTFGAGLRPDPLGELQRSSDPVATMRGPTSQGKGREIEEGRGGQGEGAEGRRRESKERGEGMGPHFWIKFTPLGWATVLLHRYIGFTTYHAGQARFMF